MLCGHLSPGECTVLKNDSRYGLVFGSSLSHDSTVLAGRWFFFFTVNVQSWKNAAASLKMKSMELVSVGVESVSMWQL